MSIFSLFFQEKIKRSVFSVNLSERNIEKLRETYPEHYYAIRSPPLLGSEEVSKLNKDDLQLLAYMPDRDDFEWVFLTVFKFFYFTWFLLDLFLNYKNFRNTLSILGIYEWCGAFNKSFMFTTFDPWWWRYGFWKSYVNFLTIYFK